MFGFYLKKNYCNNRIYWIECKCNSTEMCIYEKSKIPKKTDYNEYY